MKISYQTLPDGTLKHKHPIYGTEIWTVPDRSSRPFKPNRPPLPLKSTSPENYCDFCQANYFKTPPEKKRLIHRASEGYTQIGPLNAEDLNQTIAVFRRVTNLFEIVPLSYWVKNHRFQPSADQTQWEKNYLSTPQGLQHILEVIDVKLRLTGKTPDEIAQMGQEAKLKLADAFFGGGHELIIGPRHFKPGATQDNDLVSAGELSVEEHLEYFRFTIDTLVDIRRHNSAIRYVMVFQNWLQAAGASVEHLHRQLVGMDEYGPALELALRAVQDNPNVYNDTLLNFALQEKLIVAENAHAVAWAELGHSFPTLAVYSKSAHLRPQEHTSEEVQSISELVHACHAATGNQTPCNEEWYYTPDDAKQALPWHVLIKWRVNNLAGFEGGTKITLNPMTPKDHHQMVTTKLIELRDQRKVANLTIGTECQPLPNALRYSRSDQVKSP